MEVPHSEPESAKHLRAEGSAKSQNHSSELDDREEMDRVLKEVEQARQEIQRMSPTEVIVRYHEALMADNTNRIDAALEELPKFDTVQALAIYNSFAESPDARDREVAALVVHYLTPFDYEDGLRLWDQLIRDVDEGVRFYAYENLRDVLDSDRAGDEQAAERHLQEHGITWRDAFGLLHSYIRADDGSDLHHVNTDRTEPF